MNAAPPAPGPDMAALIAAFDWSKTPLGPASRWPANLKTSVDVVLGCGFPMVLRWGPDLIQIYNDAYSEILADHHPSGLGQATRDCWPDGWDAAEPIYQRVWRGEPVTCTDHIFRIARHGKVENGWFTVSYAPIHDGNGAVSGVLATVFETSARVRAESEQREMMAALRASEQRLRALVTATSYVTYAMSPDWTEMRQLAGLEFLTDTAEPITTWLDKYIDPADQAMVMAAIERSIRTKSLFELEHRVRRRDGSLGWTLSRAVPILDAAGEIVEWFGAAADVTERREVAERHAFLLRLQDQLREAADSAEIQSVAARCLCEQLGECSVTYGEGAAAGHVPLPALHQNRTIVITDVEHALDLSAAEREAFARAGIAAAVAIPRVKGEQLVANLLVHHSAPRSWTTGEVTLIAETAERTWAAVERARAEAALRENEARLAAIFDALPVGLGVLLGDGTLALANPAMHRYIPTQVMPSRDRTQAGRWRAFHADGTPVDPRDFPGARALRGERVVPGMEMLFAEEDGRESWTRVAAVPIVHPQAGIRSVVAVAVDIDEIKRATEALRESEERLRLLVDSVQEYALFQTDLQGRVTTWNPGAERLFGYTTSEMLGQPATRLVEPSTDESAAQREMPELLVLGRKQDARWCVRKDGSRFWAQGITELVRDDQGLVRGVAKVLRDETGPRQAEEQIRQSLAEKEALLKEVHHRVKNNLQVIISMLNLQAAQISGTPAREMFDEARNRVHSIAAIHEMLYSSGSLAQITLAEYAQRLARELLRFYQLTARVGVEVAGDGVALEIERAVPCGLLLNELVSNACKHAFPSGRPGNIAISIRQEQESVLLTVADDGVGLPGGLDPSQVSTLGLKLVRLLAFQLEGTVSFGEGPGTSVCVRFPRTRVS